MVWPPQNTGLFAPDPCIMCCAAPATPPDCLFDIVLPANSSNPFADEQTAFEHFDGTSAAASCFSWVNNAPSDVVVTSDASTEDELTFGATFTNVVGPTDANSCVQYAKILVDENASLTVTPMVGSTGFFRVRIYPGDDVSAHIDSWTSISGSHVFNPLPAGEYIIQAFAQMADGDDNFSASFLIECDQIMIPEPIVASYDDGGDTLTLEACHRFELPFLGGTFSDFAAAEAAFVVDHPNTASPDPAGYALCEGWIEVACEGNSDLALDWTTHTESITGATFAMAGDVQATDFTLGRTILHAKLFLRAGSTLGVSATVDFDADIEGLQSNQYIITVGPISLSSSFSGSLSTVLSDSDTIPTTGVYDVLVRAQSTAIADLSSFDVSVTVSSDDEMTVLPVVALYERGVGCPARLECPEA
jgi:hypothetical protein